MMAQRLVLLYYVFLRIQEEKLRAAVLEAAPRKHDEDYNVHSSAY